jgi:hypothetical protein
MLDRGPKEELDEGPSWKAHTHAWPRGVRPVGSHELDSLGVDRRGNIYWDGRLLEVPHFVLTRGQKIWAVLLTLAALAGGIGSFVQGILMYDEWACRQGLPSLSCAARVDESAEKGERG